MESEGNSGSVYPAFPSVPPSLTPGMDKCMTEDTEFDMKMPVEASNFTSNSLMHELMCNMVGYCTRVQYFPSPSAQMYLYTLV